MGAGPGLRAAAPAACAAAPGAGRAPGPGKRPRPDQQAAPYGSEGRGRARAGSGAGSWPPLPPARAPVAQGGPSSPGLAGPRCGRGPLRPLGALRTPPCASRVWPAPLNPLHRRVFRARLRREDIVARERGKRREGTTRGRWPIQALTAGRRPAGRRAMPPFPGSALRHRAAPEMSTRLLRRGDAGAIGAAGRAGGEAGSEESDRPRPQRPPRRCGRTAEESRCRPRSPRKQH